MAAESMYLQNSHQLDALRYAGLQAMHQHRENFITSDKNMTVGQEKVKSNRILLLLKR